MQPLVNGQWEKTVADWYETEPIRGTCNAGFVSDSPEPYPTATCTPNADLSNAEWAITGSCTSGCTKSDLLVNHSLVFGSWTWTEGLGEKITPSQSVPINGTCNLGVSGLPTATCTNEGWTIAGNCGAVCSDLDSQHPLVHGKWEAQSTPWGTEVKGTCTLPWTGGPQINCHTNGTWGDPVGDCNTSANYFNDSGVYTIEWAKRSKGLLTLHYQFTTGVMGADLTWKKTQLYTSVGRDSTGNPVDRQKWRFHYIEGVLNCYTLETIRAPGWFIDAHSPESGYWGLAVIRQAQNDTSQNWCFNQVGGNYQFWQQSSNNALSGFEYHDYRVFMTGQRNSRNEVMHWKAEGMYLKNVGTGLYLDSYECSGDERVVTRASKGTKSQEWRFDLYPLGANDVYCRKSYTNTTCSSITGRVINHQNKSDLRMTVGSPIWEDAQFDIIREHNDELMFEAGRESEAGLFMTAYDSDPWAARVVGKGSPPNNSQIWIIIESQP